MNSNDEKNNDVSIGTSENEIKSKRSNLPKSVYIERMITIVYYDVKFYNQTIDTFEELAQKVNESFEEDYFYTAPYIDTGKDYIREYVRVKRKELEETYKRLGIEYKKDGKVNNSYDELVNFCKKDFVTNYIKRNHFFEYFVSCEKCNASFPYAVLFVKRSSENIVSDFLLDNLDEYVKGTITGNCCLQVYFHDYECRSEFFDLFFEDENSDTQQSNTVDDTDDFDDEKQKIEKY